MVDKKPYLAVILRQAIYAGMFVITKSAFDRGMNNFVFGFYRQATATVFLAPFALIFERKTAPPLSLMTLCKFFMLSFFGITLSVDINAVALTYTSATLAAATISCVPVITFFFAVLLRMEVLKLKTRPGIAKLAGITVCIAGTTLLALYKGPHFSMYSQHHTSGHHSSQQQPSHVSSGKTWILGCLLMIISNILWGLYLVLQATVMKSYPSKLLFTTLQCFLSSIQSFVIAIAFERDPQQWRLGWNFRLLTVAYCGIVVNGVAYYLQAWIIEKKGPVFLAMWTPLSLLITIFCSAIFLGEIITLGSILGGLLLVGGLYSVLWGKSREPKLNSINGSGSAAEVDKECPELIKDEAEEEMTKTSPPSPPPILV